MKDDKFRHLIPILGGVEPWLTDRWKARIWLPVRHNWTFSPALTVEALQSKTCQDSMLSGGVGQIEPRYQGEGVVPLPMYW